MASVALAFISHTLSRKWLQCPDPEAAETAVSFSQPQGIGLLLNDDHRRSAGQAEAPSERAVSGHSTGPSMP